MSIPPNIYIYIIKCDLALIHPQQFKESGQQLLNMFVIKFINASWKFDPIWPNAFTTRRVETARIEKNTAICEILDWTLHRYYTLDYRGDPSKFTRHVRAAGSSNFMSSVAQPSSQKNSVKSSLSWGPSILNHSANLLLLSERLAWRGQSLKLVILKTSPKPDPNIYIYI